MLKPSDLYDLHRRREWFPSGLHVIALELGGAASLTANLYPEPLTVAHPDDSQENALHSQVCSSAITLSDAQSRILALKVSHGYRHDASTAANVSAPPGPPGRPVLLRYYLRAQRPAVPTTPTVQRRGPRVPPR